MTQARSTAELVRLVGSYGCKRALRHIVTHGPSVTNPSVTPEKLDTLTWLGLVGESGQATTRGREIDAAIRVVARHRGEPE